VIVLGPTGRNFAAGMSGGIAYVLDEQRQIGIQLQPEDGGAGSARRSERDRAGVGSDQAAPRNSLEACARAESVGPLGAVEAALVKVIPDDYRRVMAAQKLNAGQGPVTGRGGNGGLQLTPRTGHSTRKIAHGTTHWFSRISPHYAAQPERRVSGFRDWREFHGHLPEASMREQGARLHGLRRALLSPGQVGRRADHRVPAAQPDSGVERPHLQGTLAAGARPTAPDQQLPGIHRPRVPGPVRGILAFSASMHRR